MWTEEQSDEYKSSCKSYMKNQPDEFIAVHDNLDTYMRALVSGKHPLQLVKLLTFVHNEGKGVYAIDQRGFKDESGKSKKLVQTRLYLYPDLDTHTVHRLYIGDKKQQSRDVRYCHKYVSGLIKERENEQKKQNISKPVKGDSNQGGTGSIGPIGPTHPGQDGSQAADRSQGSQRAVSSGDGG